MSETDLASRLQFCGKTAGFLVFAFSGATLIAWNLEGTFLNNLTFLMRPGMAVSLLLAGLSLHMLSSDSARVRFGARFAGALVALIGFLTAVDYLFSPLFDVLDQFTAGNMRIVLLFRSVHLSLVASLNLAMVGTALLLMGERFNPIRISFAQVLALASLFLCLPFALSQLYGLYIPELFGPVPQDFSTSTYSFVSLIILNIGIVCVHPSVGLIRVITKDAIGSRMLRRFFPLALLVPILLAWLRLVGQRAGLYGEDIGIAAPVVGNVLCLAILLWVAAASMNHAEAKRMRAEEKRRRSDDQRSGIVKSALDAIISLDQRGAVQEFNPAAETLFGYRREQILGKDFAELMLPPVAREEFHRSLRLYPATGESPLFGKRVEAEALRADGSALPVEMSFVRLGKEEPPKFTGFLHDIADRRKAEEYQRQMRSQLETEVRKRTDDLIRINEVLLLVQDITVSLSTAGSFSDSLEVVLRQVCTKIGFAAGQAWIPNPQKTNLRCVRFWNTDVPGITEFRFVSARMQLSPSQCLPGMAWQYGRAHWSENLSTDSVFTRKKSIEMTGLGCGVAVPLMSGSKFLAVLEFFAIGTRKRDQRILDLLSAAGPQLGNVLDRKRAAEELRKRELELEDIQTAANVGTWKWYIAEDMFASSQEFLRLHGAKGNIPTNLTGYLGLIRSEDSDLVAREIRRAVKSGKPLSCEYRTTSAGSAQRSLTVRGRLEFDAKRNPIAIAGIVVDITELCQLRETALEKENLLRTLMDGVREYAIYYLDPEGTIVTWSLAGSHVYGYWPDEVIGKHWSILFPDMDRAKAAEGLLNASLSATGSVEQECLRSRRDGQTFVATSQVSAIRNENNSLVGFTVVTRDISEQKRIQEEMHAKEAEQEKLRAKLEELSRKRFADLQRFSDATQRAQEEERRRIARDLHDGICQRLSGTKLLGEAVEDEVSRKDRALGAKIRNIGRQIEESIAETRRLVANLRPPVFDDFGLGTAITFLARDFQKKQEARVIMDIDEQSRYDSKVEISLYRIAQEALTNITKHAKASRVTLTLKKADHHILLEVSDDGTGFDPLNTDHIGNGHGLGLIGMRERARSVGGSLAVRSAGGKGTAISVTIPEIHQTEDVITNFHSEGT